MKILLDSNVVIDALVDRGDAHSAARLLLGLGYIGEFELWASPTQWTDMFYILTEGDKPSKRADIKQKLTAVRKAVHVSMMGEAEIDKALASPWDDFEDAVVYQAGQTIQPDMLITSNEGDFALSEIPVFSPKSFFEWMEQEYKVTYAEIPWG